MNEPFDLIIIGAGSAGITAADFAAKLGARVALVEKGNVGGDCTWLGCVPSKALIKAAKLTHTVRQVSSFSGHRESAPTEMKEVRAYLQQKVQKIYQQDLALIKSHPGIELIQGKARFLEPTTIMVGDRKLSGKNFLIATGAQPIQPQVPGYSEAPCITYEQLFDNELLPKKLVVLGAGATGVEMAQAYGRLGAAVTVVDVGVLPALDPEVGQVIEQVFEREGIRFVEGMATSIAYESGQFEITLDSKKCQTVHADLLLNAVGRRPNVAGMDLEKAGIAFDANGIHVDEKLRTSSKNIYAAGDCTGGLQLTHYAGWQGYKAVRNMLLPGSDRGVRRIVPFAIYTDPEVAHVGLSEAEARAEFGDNVNFARLPLEEIDRAVIDGERDGFIKIAYKNNGTLLGATIVAPRAGEMISEFVLAIKYGLKVRDLAETMHVYPTYSMGIQQLAADIATKNFLKSAAGRIALRFADFRV